MKTFLKHLFLSGYARMAFAAMLIASGVAIGQFLNPIIDSGYNPALDGIKMYAGDYVSIGLPFAFLIGYSVLIRWLYRPAEQGYLEG